MSEEIRRMAQDRADFWYEQAAKNESRREHYEVVASQFQSLANEAGAGWQPIETAPKDIPVLIYVPINRPERRILAAEKGDVEWYILSGSVVLGKPTKWQPLPAPPVESKSEVVG